MKRQAVLIALLCTVLSACSGPSEHLRYVATNVEQMKKANFVGALVEYCIKVEQCNSYSHEFIWVARQDEISISSDVPPELSSA